MSAVRRRAAKHAALSDPARLLIVESLLVGDVSPKELQEILGVTSNLLAHHVRVLENQGIVTRRRSEGDRRRSYLRLVPGGLEGLITSGAARELPHDVSRVVFVCTANSARSQLAAALWARSSEVSAASAGTQPATRIDRRALRLARRHGLAVADRAPRRVDDVLGEDDFVVTVCDNAHEQLAGRDALHWAVPDPVSVGSTAAFEQAFDELDERVTLLSHHLRPHQN
jgi:protein-tyrosine-phosphatase